MFVCLSFWDRVSLCSSGCPGPHSVDQVSLELRDLPASASECCDYKCVPPFPAFLYVFKNHPCIFSPSGCVLCFISFWLFLLSIVQSFLLSSLKKFLHMYRYYYWSWFNLQFFSCLMFVFWLFNAELYFDFDTWKVSLFFICF